MVDRVMVRRFRSVLVAIAVIAAVAFAVPHTASASDSVATNGDQHTAAAVAKRVAPRTVADRAPRPAPPLLPIAVLLGGLGPVALLLARHGRLIGRRLHDADHDWRSLLLRAPPALA